MATKTEQRQRLWLDLTKHEAQDWPFPASDQNPKTRQHSTLSGPVPPKIPATHQPIYDDPPTSMMLKESLLRVSDHAVGVLESGRVRPYPERAIPNVPERSSSNGKVRTGQLSSSNVLVPSVAPPKPKAIGKHVLTPIKSVFTGSLEDPLTTYPPRKDSGYSEASLEDFSQHGKISRAEHVVAIRKRDLTGDATSGKMSKSHPASIRHQCRNFLQNYLNLPGGHNPQNTTSDWAQVELEPQIDDNRIKTFSADTPSPTPSLKIISTDESDIFDADRIIVEVLRRMDGRTEKLTKNKRLSALRVTECVTREVLCICRDLTERRPIQIV
jgi:hypothetical protein